MHESVLFIVALALALRSANAHANGLSAEVCGTFGVHHSSDRSEDPTKDVWLELIEEDGNVTDCFLPQREYWVRLGSSSLIKGFLLQAVTSARLPTTSRMTSLPEDVTTGPCRNSVSHTQIRTESSEDLLFPLTTRKSWRPLTFRYTVVFSMMSYLENRYLEIPCCYHHRPEVEPGEVTTVPPTTNSGSGVVAVESGSGPGSGTTAAPYTTLEPLGNLVEGTCGRMVEYVNKSFNMTTENGTHYTCTIKKPLKQTSCVELCEISGRPVRCQVSKLIPRRKGYTCVPYSDSDESNALNLTFNDTVTTGCNCFTPNERSYVSDSSGY